MRYGIFSSSKNPLLHLCGQPFSLPWSLKTTDHCSVPVVLPIQKCHINGIIEYSAFSAWLLLLSIFEIHPCWRIFSFLLLSGIPRHGYTTVYPLGSWKTFGLFPCFGNYKWCYYKHFSTNFYVKIVFISLSVPKSAITEFYSKCTFNLIRI